MGQSKPFRATALVVEDDEIQREMIALLLEESDFDVIQCEDAETALLALKIHHPSMLVTDVNLAGKVDGLQLARIARSNDLKMRVVVISGRPPASALPEGVTFFSKPFYPGRAAPRGDPLSRRRLHRRKRAVRLKNTSASVLRSAPRLRARPQR